VTPFDIKQFNSLGALSPPHFEVVTALAILGKTNPSLISGSRDKCLRRYSIREYPFRSSEAQLNAHNDHINTLETDREQTTLYSGSKDGIVKVWSMADVDGSKGEGNLTCRAILEGNSSNSSVNTICKLDIDPSLGQAFACGSSDRSIRIWRYNHGLKLHSQRVSDVSKEQAMEPLPVVSQQVVEETQPVIKMLSATDRLR
jgi:WD40 repeat protein